LLHALAEADDDVHSVAFSPDGRWLAASGAGKGVTIWRLAASD
jgi:WD40 repeat protein